MSQIYKTLTSGGPIPPNIPTTFVANDGTTSVPAANIENIVGNNTANNGFATWTTASGNTHLINSYGVAKWVVNPIAGVGTHQTITAALASASSGDTIFITPGTYTENFTLKSGVNLTAFSCDSLTPTVTIVGTMTASFAGTCTVSNLRIASVGGAGLSVIGAVPTIVNIENCFLSAQNNTWLSYSSSSASSFVFIRRCDGFTNATNIAFFDMASAGTLNIFWSRLFNNAGSLTPNTISAGNVNIQWSNIVMGITSSGTGGLTGQGSLLGTLTLGGSGPHTFNSCTYGTLSISASNNSLFRDCIFIGSTITGSGSMTYGNITSLSTPISVTTQVPLVCSNDAVQVTVPGSYPYTVVSQDEVTAVDTSAARTVTLPASPVNGQKHIIVDVIGSAAANNVTISGNGKNIMGTVSATSYLMNVDGGSVTVIYILSQNIWKVI